MALINCPECKKEVSDSAASCPNCGVAIASAMEFKAAGASLSTIQETSKKLKLHTLISVVAIVVGVVWLIGQINSTTNAEPSAVPVLLIVVGLLWYFVTRFRIWWHHK